ncbi:ERC1 Ethionine resistance-conferring protein 1 [Candida maltosa Xu316]
MASEASPLLHPPRRSSVSSSASESVDESEIISYVQHRRQSIASVGPENIPKSFSYPNHHHNVQQQPPPSPASPRLLTRTTSNISTRSYSIYDIISQNKSLITTAEPKTTTQQEIKVIFKYSLPLIITFLLQYSLTIASVFSVGKLGSVELAAISLSSMTANISGYAIIQGISTCLDTLCAQAFGKKEYNLVGVHFIRCNYLLLLLCLPICALWIFGSYPLLLTLKSERMCLLASRYLQILSIGIPGYILFENGKHFLQCQGIFHASTIVLCICAPLNALMNYLLVWDDSIGLGFIGAPISVVITNWLMCIMLYGYIFFVNGYQCWPSNKLWDKIYVTNWTKMINLSIPGVMMIEAEWLAFEIITLEAAKFGTQTLAAQSIISTTCVIFYQIPFALSIAAGTRIAWYIGAAAKSSAITASYAVIYSSLFVGCLNCFCLFVFRGIFVRFYTKDPVVIELAIKVLVIGALYQINDALSCATGGILRGQGRQMIGGLMNLIGYYVIALPCAFVCAFMIGWELFGLWIGMLFALGFVSLSQLYFVLTSNWDDIISDCIEEGIVEDGNLNIEAHSLLPSMSNSIVV